MTLRLDRPRDLGEILSETLRLHVRRPALFFGVGLLVSVPLGLAVYAAAGWFGRSYDDAMDGNALAIQLSGGIVSTLVATPVIAGAHALAVRALAAGEQPTAGSTLRGALAVLGPLLWAVLAASIGIVAGLILLVVPGVYVAIRWAFVAQAVAVDGAGVGAAFRTSTDLVRGRWWRVLGIVLVLQLLAVAALTPLGLIVDGLARAQGSAGVYAVGSSIVDGIGISLVALGSALLFFDLRHRAAADAPPAASV